MRAIRLLLPALLLSSPAALLADFKFLDWILGQRDLEVITVTDATPAGRQWPTPSPQQPQYYVALNFGFRDLGGVMGGITEPKSADALRTIAAALAKQGYLPAKEDSPPPTLILGFLWGTLNADWMPSMSTDLPDSQLNRQQIVRFLGGGKVGLGEDFFDPLTPSIAGLTTLNVDAQRLFEMSREDFFVAVIAAYDLESLRQHKKKKLLWTTRIACPSLGFNLPETMPAMLAIATPHIGRETSAPVWKRASEHYRPDVKIGEMQLVEYLKESPIAVLDAPKQLPKPADKKPTKKEPRKDKK